MSKTVRAAELVGVTVAVGVSLFASLYLHNQNTFLQKRLEELTNGGDEGYGSEEEDNDNDCSQDDDDTFDNDVNHKTNGTSILQEDDMVFRMKEIGIITSPYPQRAGTPRQGLLAPHSKSHLTLHSFIPKETLDDLDQYSHVWIIFQFHLNPIGKS